jgi:hypothetical protein
MNILKFLTLPMIIFFCSCGVKKNDNDKFIKLIYDLSIPEQKNKFDKWVQSNLTDSINDSISKSYARNLPSKDSFINQNYEDTNYFITSHCRGEWGGLVKFNNKQNKNIYKMESTCPLLIDFRDGKYYVLASLSHGEGFTSIKTVENPAKLTDSTGYKILLDTFGLIANQFFPFNNRNYLIYTTDSLTILGKYENNRIIAIDTLINRLLPAQPYHMNFIKNGIYINEIYRHTTWGLSESPNRHEKTTGFMYVKKDTIVIGYQYKEWFTKHLEIFSED